MKMRSVFYIWLILKLVSGRSQDLCPQICFCRSSDLHTDCRYNSLTELPEGIYSQVMRLDLSHNLFTHIPENLSTFEQLQHLNISYNQIRQIDSNSFQGLKSLRILDLSYNSFKDWIDIDRNSLAVVPQLQELDLSYNNLGGFPDIMEYPLNSSSIEILSLVNCSITNLSGDLLTGLLHLKNLKIANNPLMGLNTQIKSKNLLSLDLSQCSLERIHPDAFVELTTLEVLKLANNYELKNFNSKSNSLKVLDLSHCNIESTPTMNLPNLTKFILQGNHIRYLSSNSFSSFPIIHYLDLSNNGMIKIDVKAFEDLRVVQTIDLSYNKLLSMDYQTFAPNTKLHNLNFSNNYFSEVGQLAIKSLRWLDFSVCEIRNINKDSLIMMPKLQNLNLSRNLITHLPNDLQASELRVLDVSRCGIFQLNNETLAAMGHLQYLNLAGNKLVSVKQSFFHDVKILHLDDNVWFCNCDSDEFKELHHWLYNLMSISGLHCRYPENLAGLTWENACAEVWFVAEVSDSDGIWIYSVSLVILMVTLCCVVVSIRHAYHRKKSRNRQQEEEEAEEAREQLRTLQQRSIHQSMDSINRNAPDPRDFQTPPSYSEAISMPRLNASCNSLVGSHRSLHSLHSLQSETPGRRTKIRRKRRRNRPENKSAAVAETQSAASLSHLHTEDSSSEGQTEIRRAGRNNINVIESSF